MGFIRTSSIASGLIPRSGLNVHPPAHGIQPESQMGNATCRSTLFSELQLTGVLCHCISTADSFAGLDLLMPNGTLHAAASDYVLQGYHMVNANLSGMRSVGILFSAFKRPEYDHSISEKATVHPCFATRPRNFEHEKSEKIP